MLRPVDAPVRELYRRRVYRVDPPQVEPRQPSVVASPDEAPVLPTEGVVHLPEERLHHLRVARAVRIGERVEIRGGDAAQPRERRVALAFLLLIVCPFVLIW